MRCGCSCEAKDCVSKKTMFALEQARADVARRRQRWRSWQIRLDPRRLVFIDETWIKTSMAPLRGAERRPGARLRTTRSLADTDLLGRIALRPPHRTLRLRRPDQWRMLPRLCGAATRSRPQIGRHRHHGHLGSHKSAALRRIIQLAGARLWYLPPYSPDLNPIEQAFAKIKHWMRAAQRRTIEDTWRHIA